MGRLTGQRIHPAAHAAALGHVLDTLMRGVEAVAAALMVVETLILLAGVISRYLLDVPLVWSDELALTLFGWLAMLGAVLALDRGEHMRLTAFVNRMPARWRAWCESLGALVVCVFVALIIVPAAQHASEQMDITTPALQIPDGLRCFALVVGTVLMLIAALMRLARHSSARQLASAFVVVAVVALALWFARPLLASLGNYNLLIFFVFIVGACVALGVPIAFAFGTATLSYLALATDAPLAIVVGRMDEGMSNMILLAVPLFVLLGALIEVSGLARSLIEFMVSLLGHVRGGLQYVLLAAMFLVSGISGSKAADMAAVAPALLPEMQKRGSSPEELVALLSSAGAMTETIPPSLVLITIGAVCGISISALFVGGMLPAVVATVAIGLVCWRRSRREAAIHARRAPLRTVLLTLVKALPALALPVMIRSAVVGGIATATEVSTLGVLYVVVYCAIVSIVRQRIGLRRFYVALVDSVALSGTILLIVGTATAMAWALSQSGFSGEMVSLMQGMPGGTVGFMLVSMAAFIVLGSVLEGIPAIVLFGPLLFPVARTLGVDEVHYAVVAVLSMGLGLFAPPFGVGFYAACAIGKVAPDRVVGRVWGYLAALLVALLVVGFVPWLSVGLLRRP